MVLMELGGQEEVGISVRWWWVLEPALACRSAAELPEAHCSIPVAAFAHL